MPEILAHPQGAPPILRPLTPTTRSVTLLALQDRVRFDLSPLARCPALRTLRIEGAFDAEGPLDLSPLQACPGLDTLQINSDRLEGLDLSPLDRHPALRKVELRARQPVDLTPVAGWTGLRALSLVCQAWTTCDLSPLAALSSLKTLKMWQGEFTTLSLEPLRERTTLEVLTLACPNLRQLDLAPLAGLSRLAVLNLSFNARLEATLDPLAALRVGVVSTHRTRQISLCRELEGSPLGHALRHEISLGEIVLV